MFKIILSTVLVLGFSHSVLAQNTLPKPGEKPTLKRNTKPTPILVKKTDSAVSIFDHSHKAFTAVLKKFVRNNGAASTVDYKGLKAQQGQLNSYLRELSAVRRKAFDSWNSEQQQAFLINAYNAFTLKLIIDNYPVKSIRKIGGFFKKPWKIEFFTLLDKKRHLDWIEHGFLRKKYTEPRVHFAVNCASIGCPALLNEAFVAQKLNKQLEKQTKLFLNDSSRNYIKGDKIYISKIFDWFSEDFEKNGLSVQKFVAKYIDASPEVINKLKQNKMKINYTTYDWGLNQI